MVDQYREFYTGMNRHFPWHHEPAPERVPLEGLTGSFPSAVELLPFDLRVVSMRFEPASLTSGEPMMFGSASESLWRFVVTFRVADRVSFEPTVLRFAELIGPSMMDVFRRDERALGRFIRNILMQAASHEIDECLRVSGEHVVDPHPEDARR